MNTSKEFADWTTLRTIQAQAVATYTLREVLRRLDRLERELTAAIFSADLDGRKAPGKQRQALAEFKSEVEEKISIFYRELLSRTEEDFATLAEREDEAQRLAFPVFGKVRQSGVFNVSAMMILGASLRQWYSRQAGDLQFRTVQAMRQGLDASEAPAKLAERIKGGTDAAGMETAPVIATSKRAAEVIIRTAVTQIQSEITFGLAERLPASVDYGWQQISILDGRTTQICKSYAFKIWTKDFKPIGHSFPFAGGVPRHANCRSRIVLYMLDDGPSKELTFRAWLDTLTPQQQTQIFGKNRIALWKAGKLTEQDLIRQQWQAINPEDINNDNDK